MELLFLMQTTEVTGYRLVLIDLIRAEGGGKFGFISLIMILNLFIHMKIQYMLLILMSGWIFIEG